MNDALREGERSGEKGREEGAESETEEGSMCVFKKSSVTGKSFALPSSNVGLKKCSQTNRNLPDNIPPTPLTPAALGYRLTARAVKTE